MSLGEVLRPRGDVDPLELDIAFFRRPAILHRGHPETALSAWPGVQAQLQHWLGTGLIDAALTFQPSAHETQTSRALRAERLILVSTRPGSPLRFDPAYVYVDAGEDFGRRHAAAYADAGTAKLSFGSAVWALDHLLADGGSAYLPERLARPHLAADRLFPVVGAPAFEQAVHLSRREAAAPDLTWTPPPA